MRKQGRLSDNWHVVSLASLLAFTGTVLFRVLAIKAFHGCAEVVVQMHRVGSSNI